MEQNVQIGKIKKVDLRELWKKEDKHFTRWLEENIDYLNEVLGFDISIEKSEENAGPFKVDLFGTDNNDNKVIIENQLEKTDHDHLGKLLTYLINLEAKTAIWIAREPIEEHAKVIDWLNENAPNDFSFYLVKLEAIKIGVQPMAAPLFTVISRPSEESRELGKEKKEYAERHILRNEFWTQLLDKAKVKTKLYTHISPSKYCWIGTGAGKSGISYNYVITYKYTRCEIYLDRGKNFVDPNINKIRFDKLYKHKKEIEKLFGRKLQWERLNDRRASRIHAQFDGYGLQDKEKWDMMQDRLINTMIKLENATKDYIKKLE